MHPSSKATKRKLNLCECFWLILAIKKVCDFFETTDDLLNINEIYALNSTHRKFVSHHKEKTTVKDLRWMNFEFRRSDAKKPLNQAFCRQKIYFVRHLCKCRTE